MIPGSLYAWSSYTLSLLPQFEQDLQIKLQDLLGSNFSLATAKAIYPPSSNPEIVLHPRSFSLLSALFTRSLTVDHQCLIDSNNSVMYGDRLAGIIRSDCSWVDGQWQITRITFLAKPVTAAPAALGRAQFSLTDPSLQFTLYDRASSSTTA